MAFSISKLFSKGSGVDSEKLRRGRNTEYAKAIAAAEEWDAKAVNFIEQRAGLPINKLDDYQSYIDAGTGGIWAVFRACHLVASTLSSAGIFVNKVDSTTIIKPRPGGIDLASIIATPNRFDTFSELIYLTAHHLKLTGNAYWLKDEPDTAGRPKAIYPLLPQYVRVNPSRVDKVAGYEYTVNGETVKIPTEQMIHFKRPHPNNNIFGLGDIEAGTSLAEDALNRNLLQEKFYANGAQPSGVLTKKEALDSPEEWAAFRQKFNAEYAGRRNAGKVAFLNGDWSFIRLGLTSAEMESIAHSKWSIEQVFSLMGVPLSLAGLRDASNYACLPAGELVTMADGSPKPIEKIEAGEMIYQFDASRGTVAVPVEAIIPQGKAHVFEIHTDARSLRASDNHPVLCIARTPGTGRYGKRVKVDLVWKNACDIKTGDNIVVYEEAPTQNGVIPIENRNSIETAYFLGQYLGDGSGASVARKHVGGFCIATHENEGYQESVCDAVYSAFGLVGTYLKTGIRFNSAWLARRMVDEGLGGGSGDKQIPAWVFSLPYAERAEFLSGLIDADGTVSVRGTVTFAVANRLLSEQARHLAISLGLPVTRLRSCHQKTNFGNVVNWRWTIGIIPAAQKVLRLRNPKKKNRLANAVTGGHKTGKGIGPSLFLGGFTLPHGYGLQKVRSVNYLGIMDVFDLATVGSHTFIASGVVTHNTAKVEELNFRRYECVPLLSLIVDKLNGPGGLSQAYGGKEEVSYQLAGLIDVEQVTKEWGPLVTLGAMTLNELREKAGLARVEDPYLDQYFVNNNRLPLEMAGLVAGGANTNANDPAAV